MAAAAAAADRPRFCSIHDGQPVIVYCTLSKCRRFCCQICASADHHPHTKIDLPTASSQFLAEIINANKQWIAMRDKYNVKTGVTRSALDKVETSYNRLINDTENFYDDLEQKLTAEFQRMMQKLRTNRNTAVLEIRTHKGREVELKTEYIAKKELEVRKINEKIELIKPYRDPLSPLSNVFERKRLVDRLPAIKDEVKQLANINDVTIFYEADVSEWTAKMVAWQNDVSRAIARATDALPIFCKVSSPISSIEFHRSTIPQSVTSARYDSTISTTWEEWGPLLTSNYLSVSIYGTTLLISRIGDRYVYTKKYRQTRQQKILLNDNDTVRDAVWTREGHIVYTTNNLLSVFTKQVVVMTQAGKVLAQTQMTDPRRLTGSILDDVIYLADYENGLQQSVDGGRTWECLFKPCSGGNFVQAIKVATDRDIDEFWIIEDTKSDTKSISVVSLDSFELAATDQASRLGTCLRDDLQLDNNCGASSPYYDKKRRLSIYKRDRRGTVVRNIVSLPSQTPINLEDSRLAYDGRTSIFLSDYNNRAVHVWSVNGQYDRQLLSSADFTDKPTFLTVDEQGRLMFVAQSDNAIKVFELN